MKKMVVRKTQAIKLPPVAASAYLNHDCAQ